MLGKPLVRFCEGLERNSGDGRNIVAPPRKQAANGEHKPLPLAWGVSSLLATKPRSVSTSTVKKSVPARTALWARMNSFHVVVRLRSGAGGIPLRRRMFPTVSSDRV